MSAAGSSCGTDYTIHHNLGGYLNDRQLGPRPEDEGMLVTHSDKLDLLDHLDEMRQVALYMTVRSKKNTRMYMCSVLRPEHKA